MSRFQLIEKLGLTVWDIRTPHCFVVDAEELEALLQSAQVVKRKKGTTLWTDDFTFFNYEPDEQGILLCVEPIKKKTKAEAALELLEKLVKDPAYYSSLGAAKAKRILEMKD